MFPSHFRAVEQFAPHHDRYWQHVWRIEKGVKPFAYLAPWNRGGMKSTSAEATFPVLAALGKRDFGLYVCGTQDKADGHLESIKDMLLDSNLGSYYPKLAQPEVKIVSDRKIPGTWNHAELRTAGGLGAVAVGLDKSIRGLRRKNQRIGFIVLDDIEDEDDSPSVVQKKIARITTAILPAGAQDCAVFFVQNLIHRDSVVSQVLDGRAEMLLDRAGGEVVPAVRNPVYKAEGTGVNKRYFIIGGQETWAGMTIPSCEKILNEVGKRAWDREYQHIVDQPPKGAVFPAWNPVYHVITRAEFIKVYRQFGASYLPSQELRLPERGACSVSQDVGTTTGHPCVTLWSWRPAEEMPHCDSLFFFSEMCRPHFPPTKEQELVSPISLGKEIQDREKRWDIEVEWRQGSHEQAATRNSYAELDSIPGYKAMYFSAIKTADGAKGIAAIQDLLEIDENLAHPFRTYPQGHPDAGQPLSGSPHIFFVSADGQNELYFDEAKGEVKSSGAVDEEGFSRTQYEFPRYRYPKNAQGAEAEKPVKFDDDAMDTLKAHVARSKPFLVPYTRAMRVQKRLEQKGFTPTAAPTDATLPYWEMTRDIEAKRLYREESVPLRYGIGAVEDAFERDVDGVPDWFE